MHGLFKHPKLEQVCREACHDWVVNGIDTIDANKYPLAVRQAWWVGRNFGKYQPLVRWTRDSTVMGDAVPMRYANGHTYMTVGSGTTAAAAPSPGTERNVVYQDGTMFIMWLFEGTDFALPYNEHAVVSANVVHIPEVYQTGPFGRTWVAGPV